VRVDQSIKRAELLSYYRLLAGSDHSEGFSDSCLRPADAGWRPV
jgi:hypothetical protein